MDFSEIFKIIVYILLTIVILKVSFALIGGIIYLVFKKHCERKFKKFSESFIDD